MSQTVITQAFEALKAQEAANGGVVTLDEFVFASVPNLNITDPIDRTEGLPPSAQIVHRQAVSKTGMVNSNAVVYSVVLGADVGDFEFNWVGLLNKASGVVAMIVHAPSQKKIRSQSGQQGNVLTRSFLMEYNGASQQTQIITPADTWQIDFTARLNGVDERIRLENIDMYGVAAFIGDGFLVSRHGNGFAVKNGVGYVAGLRCELLTDQLVTVNTRPTKIWVDACWQGTMTSVWATTCKIVIADELVDYSINGEQHFVSALAEIKADGSVVDLRPAGTVPALSRIKPEPDTVPFFDENARFSITALSGYMRAMLGAEEAGEVLGKLGLVEGGQSTVPAGCITFKQPLVGAVARTLQEKNQEYVSALDFGAICDGTYHPLSEFFATLAAAKFIYPFVTSLAQSVDWAACQAAVNSGSRVRFTCLGRQMDYLVNEEIAVTTAGQVLEFDGAGGYGYADYNFGSSWQKSGVRFIPTGEFARRVRTRRNWRGSASDPQDAPLSVVFNIQAEGVHMYHPCVWLNCDYSNASPDNFGDDCDVGIFVGSRVGVQIHEPVIVGYLRKAGIYFDVTQSDELPRFPDINGVPYPDGTVKNLGDGTHLFNPYIRGARVGLCILGAKPKPGRDDYSDPYYDEIVGQPVQDYRGRGGFSDFLCVGGRIFGPDHHSARRLADPTLVGGVLTQAGMESEPDFSPAAVWISGLANNASKNLWGMRFYGTRIATWEMFRVRLDKASRIVFDQCHIEGRNNEIIRKASGQVLDGTQGSNDYTYNTYGHISGTSRTSRCSYYGAVSSTVEDSIPHFYGTQFQLHARDGSRIFVAEGGYLSSVKGNLDIRAPEGAAVLFRNGSSTICQVGADGFALSRNNTYRLGSSAAGFTEAWARTFRTTLSTGEGGPGPGIYSGEGSPEGVVAAVTGSKYYRTGLPNAATLSREWVKDVGNGNTGWVAR